MLDAFAFPAISQTATKSNHSVGQNFEAMSLEGQGSTKAFPCGLEYGLQTKGKWWPGYLSIFRRRIMLCS
jgi:hypothetical protein